MPDDPLRELPSVTEILTLDLITALISQAGRDVVLDAIREALRELRTQVLAGGLRSDRPQLIELAVQGVALRLDAGRLDKLSRVINATGIILHTGLGRAPLAQAAVTAVQEAAGYCNLEVDPRTGDRRQRGYQVATAWRQLTGAEASCIVNNNAAATLLTLQSLCAGREVIISRGQLIEIGGSFRLPEIFALGGCTLREVGTTNRTQLSDYAAAIGPQTAAILRVHPSNYRVVGFTSTPDIGELVTLGHQHGLLVIDDIGSGCLIDLTRYGLPAEPTFQDSLRAGADAVLGSGDKLLGGPQCGIILGRAAIIRQIQRHPLARAVRIDKLTLAALAATLDIYLRGQEEAELPVLGLMAPPLDALKRRAAAIVAAFGSSKMVVTACGGESAIGGGSLPGIELPTVLVAVRHPELSAQSLAEQLRTSRPHIFSRIQADTVLLDLRTVSAMDDSALIAAIGLVNISTQLAKNGGQKNGISAT